MVRAFVLVVLFACHKPTPQPVTNTAPFVVEPDAAPELSACERHHVLEARAHDCAALSDEIKQAIDQRGIDMLASVSESGMDGSTPVDAEALCEEEIEYLMKVAGAPCDLR